MRSEHIGAFEEQQRAGFRDRLLLHLKEDFPSECGNVDDNGLRIVADRSVQLGASWGVEEEQDVERLCELCLCYPILLGQELPSKLQRLVRDPNRSAGQLLNDLGDTLRFGDLL